MFLVMENYINNKSVLLDVDYNWTCIHTFEELSSISKFEYTTKLKLFDDEVWKSGTNAGFSRYEISNYGRINV